MAAAAAGEIGCSPDHVLVSSTGVIGVPLPIEKIENGIPGMRAELQADPYVGARGIMTTDTYPKVVSLPVGNSGAVLTLVGKGAGMIEPNMATMLVYIFTDARFTASQLDGMLREAVAVSFNMLSVDTDTSTSDTCAIMASGLAGDVSDDVFRNTLRAGCIRMTELLARDGEGATKMIRCTVNAADSSGDARKVAKSVINSPLVKTMAHGADPNVGRLLMAIGKCFDVQLATAETRCAINGVIVLDRGARTDFDEDALRTQLRGDPIDIEIDLGVGNCTATAYGCDLTAGYVAENASYYSS
jgi:glutamate N-acetyltransferase/amino-acid N-acetyltransferase